MYEEGMRLPNGEVQEGKERLCENHIASYLAHAWQIPLLTKEQEVSLATNMHIYSNNAMKAALSILPGSIAVANKANEYSIGNLRYHDAADLFGMQSDDLKKIKKIAPKILSQLERFSNEHCELLKQYGPGLNGALDRRLDPVRREFSGLALSLKPKMLLIEKVISQLNWYVPSLMDEKTRFATSMKINEVPSYFLNNLEMAKSNYDRYLKERDKFLEANLRLVVDIAKRYTSFLGNSSYLGFMDLISAGNQGALKAIERFDPKKMVKFSTFGSWWIRQSIKRSIDNTGRGMRKAVGHQYCMSKINGAITEIRTERDDFDYNPPAEEIADFCGLSPEFIQEKLDNETRVISLEQKIGNGDGDEFGYFIEDKSVHDPRNIIHLSSQAKKVNEILNTLPEIQQNILKLRYGFFEAGGEPLTLEQIGLKFNLTKERIRQLQATALEKLRHPTRSNILREFRP